MKLLAFAIVGKLGGQYRLDMLRLPRHQEPDLAKEGNLDAVGAFWRCPIEDGVVEVVELVLALEVADLDEEGESWIC